MTLGLGNSFLDVTPKGQAIKEKKIVGNYKKLKSVFYK